MNVTNVNENKIRHMELLITTNILKSVFDIVAVDIIETFQEL